MLYSLCLFYFVSTTEMSLRNYVVVFFINYLVKLEKSNYGKDKSGKVLLFNYCSALSCRIIFDLGPTAERVHHIADSCHVISYDGV